MLKSFKASVSDSHNQGRGVASLKFESGLKLIYKPKNLEIEQAFSSLLTWFNENGLKPTQKLPDIIQKGEYGWVGFIEADECKSEEDFSDYYRRIGALTGIIYMLNGNDCHYENLIASGPFPVIIDLETIMHHDGESLSRTFLHAPSPNPFWLHFKSEIRQMEEMDIPIFRADSGCIDLKDNKGILVEDYVRYPVYNQVENQLMEMDKKDMLKQISYIRASLFFRGNDIIPTEHSIEENQFKKLNILPVNSELLLKAASEIGYKLFEEAVFSVDGGCSWISPVFIGESGKLAMQPISWFLYEGLAGVALFLSALRSISDDHELLKIAMEGADQIIARAEKTRNYHILTGEAEEFFNPVFFRGISGIGYEFIRMAYPQKFPSVLIFE